MKNKKDLYKHLIGCTIIDVNTQEAYDIENEELSSLKIKDANGKEYELKSEHNCHDGIEYIEVTEINKRNIKI